LDRALCCSRQYRFTPAVAAVDFAAVEATFAAVEATFAAAEATFVAAEAGIAVAISAVHLEAAASTPAGIAAVQVISANIAAATRVVSTPPMPA
jgi:hypothetical protein